MEIKELQSKLNGVYDLTNVVDCQSVIRVLLRDLDKAHADVEAAESRLKFLAFCVAEGKPDVKQKADEILAKFNVKKRSPGEVMDFLMRMSEQIRSAENMSNEELIGEVLSKIWAGFHMDSRESAILEELIERFKKARAFADEEGPKYEVKKT